VAATPHGLPPIAPRRTPPCSAPQPAFPFASYESVLDAMRPAHALVWARCTRRDALQRLEAQRRALVDARRSPVKRVFGEAMQTCAY
jgi:hypothetical protein